MSMSPIASLLTCALLICVARGNSFTTSSLNYPNGTAFSLPLVSVLAFSPTDPGLLLVGDLAGTIRLLRVRQKPDLSYIVAAEEHLVSVGKGRSLLGLASDPFDPTAFYASTSNIQWVKQGLPASGWQNGKIERVRLSPKPARLSVEGTVISGLPVSNSPSGLGVFGSVVDWKDASLYVGLATFTGGGVATESGGNIPDTIASSSILKADIRTHGKTLAFEWSSDAPGAAQLKAPSDKSGLEIFAVGLRSPFQPVYMSSGDLFVVDGGANTRDEKRSTSCSSDVPITASEPDKVIRVESGAYYGHANRARGASDPKQCVFITANASQEAVRLYPGYKAPLFTNAQALQDKVIFGGTVGVAEYVHDWELGLRGTLLGASFDQTYDQEREASKATGIASFDVKKKTIRRVANSSSTGLAVDVIGSAFAAQTTNSRISISVPDVSKAGRRQASKIQGVWPPSAKPGARIFIVGTNLPVEEGVTVGGAVCSGLEEVDGYSLADVVSCQLPARGYGGRKPVDVEMGCLQLRKAITILA